VDDQHDGGEKFCNTQVAGIRPTQVLPAAKNDKKPHNPQESEHAQNQNHGNTVNLHVLGKKKKGIQGKICNEVDGKDGLQIVARGLILSGDFNSLVPIGGEKVQQNIDQKNKIDEINYLAAKFVSRMPKYDLERYQCATYQY
jgi:hypothetical protein